MNTSLKREELTNAIGIRIKELRLQKKITQKDLGFELGIDAQSISRIERGKTNITVYLLYRLSIALDVKPSDVVVDLK